MRLEIHPAERKKLLELARRTIAKALGESLAGAAPGDLPEIMAGAFVTLKKDGNLRGCIGRMEARESLSKMVADMALAAAFDDPRFPPLEASELAALDIEITVLGPRRQVASVEGIEIGRHGVQVQSGGRSAVFLPQVATEQGWDRERLLRELCHKAGLPPESWRREDAVLFVFEGLVFGEVAEVG